MQAQTLEEKGALTKVSAFEAQLHLARDNASVQVDMIARLESDLSTVRAEIMDGRDEVAFSRAKYDQEMAIHLKDATDAQAWLRRALNREKRIEEYVHCRSWRKVLEKISARGFILLEKLARTRADKRGARSLLVDIMKNEARASRSKPSWSGA